MLFSTVPLVLVTQGVGLPALLRPFVPNIVCDTRDAVQRSPRRVVIFNNAVSHMWLLVRFPWTSHDITFALFHSAFCYFPLLVFYV